MIRRDYHVHTTFCDGKNTAEEMVKAAIALGMDEIGFSSHAHQPFDFDYCMSKENSALLVFLISASIILRLWKKRQKSNLWLISLWFVPVRLSGNFANFPESGG